MVEYRAEIVLWAVSGILPLIMLSIWSGSQALVIAGITTEEITRYFISAFVVRQFTAVWVMVTFEEDYVEGKLSPYLLQPLTPFWRYLSSHLAEQITRIPIVIIMLIFVFSLLPKAFFIPNLSDLALGILIIFIAFLVRFLLHWTFAMLCFWNERSAAFERVLLIPYIFLSGMVAPLDTFPEQIKSIVMLTPFPYFLYFPARILSGSNIDVFNVFLTLIVWGFILFLCSLIAWRRGIKHYSAMGA
ncbi:multidrug ABC transporter permease [Prochlorococcus sp. MIT 1341]|uniref:ABC transporter permease n=1 Tax=Prochlorococcus sp. MIT 1341 TaxID=3096221 RepID=UPI002A74DF33|nr:multidrug ABC transporter permease [Prochlorococcus sp. MIT 1341]